MMKKVLWIMVLAVLMLCAPMLAEADYTVEFTRNELQYVMPGDTSVALSEILIKII